MGNTVAFNSGPGVEVSGSNARGNSILSNSIYSNAGGGIVLTNGANDSQAAPILTAALSPGSTLVEGTLAVAARTSYLVQYFFNNPASNQGQTLFGSQTVSSAPLRAGRSTSPSPRRQRRPPTRPSRRPRPTWRRAIPRSSPTPSSWSARSSSPTPTTAGSARSARRSSPPTPEPGPDTIELRHPAGVHTISPASPLPTITDQVIINGTTQPGFAGTPIIELDGSSRGRPRTA